MKKKPVLVIMAAGMGSRYGGLKQIDPVDGEGNLIIDFSIYDAVAAGFEKIIFIIKINNKPINGYLQMFFYIQMLFQIMIDLIFVTYKFIGSLYSLKL